MTYPRLPILLLSLVILLVSCEKEEPIPLREPVPGGTTDRVYDYAATADSMQEATRTTYLGGDGTYVISNQGTTQFGNYWPNAHALHTLVDGYERTGDPAYLPRMIALLRGIKVQNGGTYSNVFNDDMLWLGNSSMRAYNATGNTEYLEVAEFLWQDVLGSYSEVFGGGITWKKDTPRMKNAVSNGPAIVLAMRLYEVNQDTTYLDWAKRLYDWQRANLLDPDTGEVWDNIYEEDGEVKIKKEWVFTYNMGTWIGAGLRLYNATGSESYLNDALRTARRTTVSPQLTTEGLLRDEGQGDGGLFKGILVRYLTDLILSPDIRDDDRDALVRFMRFNGETLHDQGIRRPDMIVGPDWRTQPDEVTDLTTQLSGLMLIEAMAKLAAAGLLG
ncbi:glycoside hydrolase family 76 protein [Neolewinella sp.]|uniref:glycoside hydrolase family 76 protein n=1 Tax=Neolewinella sp. TaxID=2993543 RepID=UPI003B525DB1